MIKSSSLKMRCSGQRLGIYSSRQLVLSSRRWQHTSSEPVLTASQRGDQLGKPTKLSYAYRSVPETYRQVVEDAELSLQTESTKGVHVVTLEEIQRQQDQEVPEEYLRHRPNQHPGLSRSQQARLDPSTAVGKSIGGKMLVMQDKLASKINSGLQYFDPQKVRANTSKYYISLQNGGFHKPSVMPIDVDTHVAGLFLQNYASAYNVLSETRKRLGVNEWRPNRVLDVGFGPSTGIVAFNEVFSSELSKGWRPESKVSVVIGHPFMLKRARTILSSQPAEDFYEAENRINTKIQSHMPQPGRVDQKFDLIMATHQLFRGTHNFPATVDDHVTHLLNLLAPGGALVIIERGDPNGFETIARARQLMFRPEDYEHSEIKSPRIWKGGRNITETTTTTTTKPMTSTEEDPDFDLPPELLAEFTVEEEVPASSTTTTTGNVHLEIVAPCSHHGKCPLQIGQEARERDTAGVFNWCKFAQLVQRPKFSVELKKGVFLATKWSAEDSGRGDNGKGLGGSGRPNGRGHETSTFSYMVVRRTEPPVETQDSAAAVSSARILKPPLKRDGHVIMEVCAPTGKIEQWTIPKSYSRQAYHDARKASGGDLWALGSKTQIARTTNAVKLEELLAKKKSKPSKSTRDKKKNKASASASSTEDGEKGPKQDLVKEEDESLEAEDGSQLEEDAWHTSAPRYTDSGNRGGARAGRKRVTTSVRGHDPDPLLADYDDGSSLEAYFEEIGEIEKNSSRYRKYERDLKRRGGSKNKKNKSKAFY